MSKVKVPQNYSDLYSNYGNPADPDFQEKWLTSFKSHLSDGKEITVECHKAMAPSLAKIMHDHKHLIHTYDGCYNFRPVRGGTHLSLHAWGLAVDLNAGEYPLGSHTRQPHELNQAFKDAGYWLGADFHHRPDPMHFQYSGDF